LKKSVYSRPDPFSLSPLLLLLPVRGKISRLESLTSSLFARYEKVSSLHKDSDGDSAEANYKRTGAEQLMLKQVLDWLSIKPED